MALKEYSQQGTTASEPTLPGGFPRLPESVLKRFPDVAEYHEESERFWRKVRSAVSNSTEEVSRDIASVGQVVEDLSKTVTTDFATLSAAITAEAEVRVDADGALAIRAATLESQVQTPITGLLARVSTVEATYATTAFAEAKKTEAIAAAAGDATAKVLVESSARAAADGAIYAQWGVSININGAVTGRVHLDGSGSTSEFLVDATKFTVWNGTSGVPPFQVIGGQVRVQSLVLVSGDVSGLAATATSSDFASVTGATKPANNADVTLAAINGGLVITSGGITLNGSPSIKSFGYTAGVDGWQIDGSGSAEFNDVTVRGVLYSSAGTIGGFTLAADNLSAGSGSTYVEFGTASGIKVGGTSSVPGYGNTDVGFAVEPTTNAIFASRSANFAAAFNRNDTGALVVLQRLGVEVGTIAVSAGATAYNTTSDRRLKTNIADAIEEGDAFDRIKVRTFEFLRAPGRSYMGFIAQELYQTHPDAVTAGDDGETVTRSWSVDLSKLVPNLVLEVQGLRRRVRELERNALNTQ